jgi:hypothetical protein
MTTKETIEHINSVSKSLRWIAESPEYQAQVDLVILESELALELSDLDDKIHYESVQLLKDSFLRLLNPEQVPFIKEFMSR